VVENRTGGQGDIAMAAVARAPADGYTLALMPVGNAAVNPSLIPNLAYDPVKDFAPITQLATVENVLVIGAQSPIRTLKELIESGRLKAANLSYATPGAGSLAHLAAELLARAGGLQLNHIPYRGVTPALTDVVRGDVTMMFAQLSTAKPFIDGGQLRPLGIASRERSAVLPNLPTVAEAGVPGFSTTAWFALFGPANMAPELIEKIHADVGKVLDMPQSREFFRTNSFERVDLTPAQFSQLIQSDLKHWGALIKAVGAKLD
jgi:tripartite-type tricarboxylate transporter receptor subunit TctC